MTPGVRVLIIVFSFAMIAVSFLIGWWAKRKVTSARHISAVPVFLGRS
ncbi:MAG: hypothetical protein HPY70_13330 [Firmicutes bacterium]|nr:hypothetical protein [Bacillota bacterium]